MKEHPILFSATMVRALLAGNKTQTRRAVKGSIALDLIDAGMTPEYVALPENHCCPYGQPGDQLWVRETHRVIMGQTQNAIAIDYKADDPIKWTRLGDEIGTGQKWIPSIHMRREYSRFQLEITAVRIERLHDISEADAIAEGMTALSKDGGKTIKYGIPDSDGLPGNDDYGWHWQDWHRDPRMAYQHLWEQINGAGSWSANPWVWVVEFRALKGGAK